MYDLGDRLVIVATDRISAFDWVLPTPIPDKGRVLTALTRFWLETLAPPNHLISTDLRDMPPAFQAVELEGRTCLVRKREWRRSSAWCAAGWPAPVGRSTRRPARYAASHCLRVCGRASCLPRPIFTPATKEEHGHDQNISFEETAKIIGAEAAQLRDRSIDLYRRAADHAAARRDPGGHQVRVGLDAGRDADPGGRGADAGQLALLARRWL